MQERRFGSRVLETMIYQVVATQIFLIFTPKIGEDEPILASIFQMGWFNHQLDNSAGHFENLLLKHLHTENGMVS